MKKIIIVISSIIILVNVFLLVSYFISRRTPSFPSKTLPVVPLDKEKARKPARITREIPVKPPLEVEGKVLPQPIPIIKRETEYRQEETPAVPYDEYPGAFVPREVEPGKFEKKVEDVELKDEEAERMEEEGPPSSGTAIPLPMFEPITSGTGPVPTDQGSETPPSAPPGGALPQELPPVEEETSQEGPPVPLDFEGKPLPPFTPITSETGPVADE